VLAEAVAMLGADSPPLLVIGPDGWWADDVKARVRAADRHGRIRFLGELPEAAVDAHLAHATVVCHPSFAEGFGMVCLESMALGVPVVAADLASVREVGGDAVRLVPPGDAAAMADAIRALLDDPGERERLGRAGVARAATFTWERTAAGVAEAYQRAFAGPVVAHAQ
jgi:glycosyltransferase involved in cell wall biosynthesis